MKLYNKRVQRVNLVVTGAVQGVGFRYYARDEAKKLGLTGWVRNREDGKVEIAAEGEHNALEELITSRKS